MKKSPWEQEKRRPWTMPGYDDHPKYSNFSVMKPLTRKEVTNARPVVCFGCREKLPPTHAHQVLVKEAWRWACADCQSIARRPS